MKTCLAWILIGVAASASAGERKVRVAARGHCGHVAAQSVVQLSTGLTVVPFAVPVAVPVAVVSQPAVVYAYRAEVSGQWPVVSGQTEVESDLPSVTGQSDAAVADQRRIEEQTRAAAVGVLQNRCAACHAGESAKGELRIFDDSGAIVERLPRRAMLEAAEAGQMPKGAAPLTEEELSLLREWARPPRDLAY